MSQRKTVVSDWPEDMEDTIEMMHHKPPFPKPPSPKPKHPCPHLPGTIIRIFIPPGAVINLLNLIELSSPGGICIILRLPLLGGAIPWSALTDAIKQAGGSFEVTTE